MNPLQGSNSNVFTMFVYLLFGCVIVAVAASKTEEDRQSVDIDNMLDHPYCGLRYRRLCHGKGRHVACQFPTPGPGESCLNYTKVKFNRKLPFLITNYINRRRQRIATGQETARGGVRIPQPEIMMQVEWDKELSMLAQRLADQCSFVHDDCRATVRYPYAGQTVGEVKWRRTGNSDQQSIARAVRRVLDAWWGERRRVTVRQLTQPFRLSSKGNIWGHFSQIAVWTLRAVGCGMVRHGSRHPRILMVCDFSHTNMLGQSTIVPGKIAPCPIHTLRRLRSSYPLLCGPIRLTEYHDDMDEEDQIGSEPSDEALDGEMDDNEDSVVIPNNASLDQRYRQTKLRDKIGFEEPREELQATMDNGDQTAWQDKGHEHKDPETRDKVTTYGDEDYNDIGKNKHVETVRQKVTEIANEHAHVFKATKPTKSNVMLKKLEQELKIKHRDENQFSHFNLRGQRPTAWIKHTLGLASNTRMSEKLSEKGSTIDTLYQPVSHRWRPDNLFQSVSYRWLRPLERSSVKVTPDYADAESLVMLSPPPSEDEAATHPRTRWRSFKVHSPRPGAKALPGLTSVVPEAPFKAIDVTGVSLKMAKEDMEQLFKDTGFKPTKPQVILASSQHLKIRPTVILPNYAPRN